MHGLSVYMHKCICRRCPASETSLFSQPSLFHSFSLYFPSSLSLLHSFLVQHNDTTLRRRRRLQVENQHSSYESVYHRGYLLCSWCIVHTRTSISPHYSTGGFDTTHFLQQLLTRPFKLSVKAPYSVCAFRNYNG